MNTKLLVAASIVAFTRLQYFDGSSAAIATVSSSRLCW